MKFVFLTLSLFLIFSSGTVFAEDDAFFPFSPSWDIAADSPVNLSCLNRERPISRLHVDTSGHLADDQGRVRLVGINITDIPEKTDAAIIARKFSAMGINIVRLHHLDALWTMNSLYEGPWEKPPVETVSKNLDKLDYFLNELAKENIIINFNFLTGRYYMNLPGMPGFVREMKDWKEIHTLVFFRPEVQQLQKNTIREILSHKNPYRNLTYAEDPLIALVEIINENGLMHSWQTRWLDAYPDSDDYLKNLWNSWLKKKYGSQIAFEHTLNPDAGEMTVMFNLKDFTSNPQNAFHLENHQGAQSELSGKGGNEPSVRLKTKKPGSESWHIQFGRSGFTVEKGTLYTLSFEARSRAQSGISVSLSMADSPWQNLGFNTDIQPGKNWNTWSFSISPLQDYRNARFMFSGFGLSRGADVELKNIRLTSGGSILAPDQSIDKGTVAWPRKGNVDYTPALKREWLEFLYDLEARYWFEMNDWIRKTNEYQGLVIGTIVGTSTHLLQSRFDIVDAHAYFNHPVFTETPWDMKHWYVVNRPLVREADLDILSALAEKRVTGKPFIVSEIDSPAPNEYNVELFPVLAAFALAQDWDGYFAFTVSVDNRKWTNKRINGFFDNVRNTAKAAGFQAAALAFRRADFPAFKKTVVFPVDREKEIDMVLNSDWGWNFGSISSLGWNRADSLKCSIAVSGAAAAPLTTGSGPAGESVRKDIPPFADTGISFDSVRGWFSAVSEKSIFCSGFFPKGTWSAGSFTFSGFKSSTGFGLVAIQTCGDFYSGSILLTAASGSKNSSMDISPFPGSDTDNRQLTARADFGKAPVFTETPEGTVSLQSSAGTLTVRALDENGSPGMEVPVQKKGNMFTFTIGRKYRTVWYELVPE